MELIKQNGKIINLNNRHPLRSVTKAEYKQSLLSEDYISLSVESKEVIDFNLNDKIEYNGKFYHLNFAPKVKKERGLYLYDLTFEGSQYLLRKKVYFNLDQQNIQTSADFSLTGKIDIFLRVLISNINSLHGQQWRLGEVPTNTEAKTLTFNSENCLAVLQKICQEYDTEFEIIKETQLFTLNVKKVGKTLPFSFQYGKGNGLYSLSRDNVNNDVVTRLYAFGSTENIPSNYRGFSDRLRMPTHDYIQDNANVALFGLKEGVKYFDDIKPTFKGIVSQVKPFDQQTKTQELIVSNMDFDLNERDHNGTKWLIPDTPAKLHFNKGNLAGYQFELAKVRGYNHATKTFRIKQIKDEKGQVFPDQNTSAFSFQVGDEFTLLDIVMPPNYIANAENKLLSSAKKEYEKQSKNNAKYTLNIDPLFLKHVNDKTIFNIGDYINIIDTELGIDKTSRIISISQDLREDFNYQLDIADNYEINFTASVLNEIKDTKAVVKTQEQVNREQHLNSIRNLTELRESVFDTEGYFDPQRIKPESIETNMLNVGAKTQQFALENVTLVPNVEGNPSSLSISGGKLVHFTLEDNIREWSMAPIYLNNLTNNAYYVYAKVSRSTGVGSWLITVAKIRFDERDDFYHFLCFILYTPRNGKREADAMYGNVNIHGGQINAGRIRSNNGKTFIDLDTGEISGKITFSSGSSGFENLTDKPDLEGLKGEVFNNAKAYADAQDNLSRIAAQAYADLKITEEERRAILEAEAKLNEAKQHAQGLVKGIKIGGRNLMRNSRFFAMRGNDRKNSYNETEGIIRVKNTPNTWNAYTWVTLSEPHEVGDNVVFSMYIKSSIDCDIRFNYIAYYDINFFASTERLTANQWKRISVKGVIKGKNSEPSLIGISGSEMANAVVEFRNAQIERGNKSTEWNFAPEDIDVQISTIQNLANQALGLTQSQTANITALENKTNFLQNTAVNGNGVATGTLVVGNGLGANAGITGLGGGLDVFLWGGTTYQNRHNAPISLHRDGFLRVRNAQGRVIFEIGQKNGEAVFDIYNNEGIKVAGIGQRGIEFVGYIPENYDEKLMLKLNNIDFNNDQSILGAIGNLYAMPISGAITKEDEEANYYRVTFVTDTTAYSYSAGRNFETPSNAHYEQFIFAQKNKFGHKLANGIYALQSTAVASNSINGGYFELQITIYKVEGGRIVQSKAITKTGYLNNIIIN